MSGLNFATLILIIYFSYGETNKINITKCCPENYYVGFRKVCKNTGESYDFDKLVIYDRNIRKTEKKVLDIFELVPANLRHFTLKRAYDLSKTHNNYLIEDGTIMQELPNTYDRFKLIDNDKFCIDIALPNGKNIFKPQVRLWTYPVEIPPDDYQMNSVVVVSGLMTSSFFLILVLIVYSLLPELRNLCGMILMAYVVSLLGAFLMLGILYIVSIMDQNPPAVCLGLTFVIYCFFISCFCWMNVMSIDIWWTFRGYAKARPIHRRGEKFKFAMYCLYAFGLPLVMTAVLAIIHFINLTHIPWFIKPALNEAGCFIEGHGKFVYLYIPMLTIIIMNWILFLMTAFNIWRLSRGTAVLDSPAAGNPSAHRTHRHRFMLYLKLSVIMGVSWVLEVASAMAPEFRGWYLTDAYNLLMGFFIFLIFVCKKKIFKKLEKRLCSARTQWSPISKSRSTSVSSDSDSQDTTTQICSSPSGASYYKA